MNLLNRLLVSAVFLSLFAGAIAVIALAWAIPGDSIDGLRDAVQWLDDNDSDLNKAYLTVIAGLVALLSFLVLVAELMPSSSSDVKVTDVSGGSAMLSTSSIGQRVAEAVRALPNVSDVKAVVTARRKGVEVFLDLHVDPDANLAAVADSAIQSARQVLNERVHVAVIEPPRVRLHYRELRLQKRPATEPAAEVPSAAPETAATDPAAVTDPDWKPAEPAEASADGAPRQNGA